MNITEKLQKFYSLIKQTMAHSISFLMIMRNRKYILITLKFKIFRDDKCIVDVRDPISKEIIPYKKFINMYVIKAEPNRAILEPDYFIKMIEQAERRRDEEIERVEAGIIDDELLEEPDIDNEWEKLQMLSNEEYLMKTVLPVLY